MHDGAAAEVEEVLAGASVAGAGALPAADMGEGVLDRRPLPQLRPALACELPMAELVEEALVGVDVDAAAVRAGGAALPQRARPAAPLGEVDGGAGPERDDD